ncbi:MAG: glycosyltransferase family 4 protein [Alphaproteobacteria bacterium]|nr:glycosyltransferase family 4 protein [Alphaproteobacteria bacterium]
MTDPKKRVAVVAPSFPPSKAGGVASSHERLASLLEKSGCQVRRFAFLDGHLSSDAVFRACASDRWKRTIDTLSTLFFRLADPSGRAYQTSDILKSLPGARRLKRGILDFAPHEIILPDHGCPGLGLGAFPSSSRVTLVAHHNPMRFVNCPGLNSHSPLDAKIAVALENFSLSNIHRVIAPCHYMAAEFRQTYRFSGDLAIIPNLIDIAELDAISPLDPRREMGLAPQAPLIYIPSAGSRIKGSAMLPELIRRIADLYQDPFGLYLSGSVSEQLVHQLPNHIPVFTPGHLPVDTNLAYVKSCSFALSPTLVENFSMALLEVQMMGLAVVTFDIGGNRELVSVGQTGFIVAPFDVVSMAGKASELLLNQTLFPTPMLKSLCRARFDPDRWLPLWVN